MPIRYIDGHRIKRALLASAQYLEHRKEYINQLNVFPVPDGDTGSNMARTVWGGISTIKDRKDGHAGRVLSLFAEGALLGARGNSGVILSQVFQGMSERVRNIERIDAVAFAESLDRGCSTAYGALLEPQEGTILTVMKEPSARVLEMAGAGERDIGSMLMAYLNQAHLTLQATPERLKVLKDAGVVDAGGYGLVTIVEGMLNIVEDATWSENEPVIPAHEEQVWEADPHFQFCMVFSIRTTTPDIDCLKNDLAAIGGSVLCARGKNMIKVHVHSNDPDKVMSLANRLGNVADLKKEDMRAQQRMFLGRKPPAFGGQKTGLVAVVPGEGFARILQSLGVHRVLFGGPTMNPSVAELLVAVNELAQDHVIIFPNDKNTILTAGQVKIQSSKNVEVIATAHVPQAISAMLNYDPELGAAENANVMKGAADRVSIGAVTTAMRNVELSGVSAKSGEIISLLNDQLFSSHLDSEQGVLALLDAMVVEDAEVISIYFGKSVADKAPSLKDTISARYPDHILEFHGGGQDHYFYIISVE